jgi:hypothetical protein
MSRWSSTRRFRPPDSGRGLKSSAGQYAARAGIGATHEQAVRRCGLRRCRHIGQVTAHLQHVLKAAALDVVRLDDWWARARVSRICCSRFATLQQAA